jgi:hypothetical protein
MATFGAFASMFKSAAGGAKISGVLRGGSVKGFGLQGSFHLGLKIAGQSKPFQAFRFLEKHSRIAYVRFANELAIKSHQNTVMNIRMGGGHGDLNLSGSMRQNLVPKMKVGNKTIPIVIGSRAFKSFLGIEKQQTQMLVGVGEQSALRYTAVQELGNKGKLWIPPRTRIFEWARRRGLNPDQVVAPRAKKGSWLDLMMNHQFGLPTSNPRPVKRGDLIWAKIARKGIPGKFFMTRGVMSALMGAAKPFGKIYNSEFRTAMMKAKNTKDKAVDVEMRTGGIFKF